MNTVVSLTLPQSMPSAFDPYMPRIRLQFAEAGVLSIGTVSCDDQIHQAVYLAYTPKGCSAPTMELELPPKSVEIIIQQLQDHANQARFINGERMLEYPKPRPEERKSSGAKGKVHRRKKPAGQSSAPNAGLATPADNSGLPDGPPSVS